MTTTPGPTTDLPAPPEDPLEGILRTARVIAVVGLSPNPARPSYGVARYLQAVGYRIVPVHPGVEEILSEPTYPTLEAISGREAIRIMLSVAVGAAAIRFGTLERRALQIG